MLNMAGIRNGTAAIIIADYPLDLHCASRCLNVAVVKSLQVSRVMNMIGCLGRVFQFFDAHSKRDRALEEAISTRQPSVKIKKLKDMCCIRWIQSIDAIDVFGRALEFAITSADFLCALVITNHHLRHVQALTTSLQAKARDIVQQVLCRNHKTIQDVHSNVNTHHAKWFRTIQKCVLTVVLCHLCHVAVTGKRIAATCL